MFDGNFRSRKEVDLSSGGSRRRGAAVGNKQALLRNADEQRRRRQEHQRKDQATRYIQRCARGWLVRLHILDAILPTAAQHLAETSYVVDKLRPWLSSRETTVVRLLVNYSHQWSLTSEEKPSEVSDAMDLGSTHGSKSTTVDALWYSQKQLVHATLRELSAETILDKADLEALFSLLLTNWPSLLAKRAPDDWLYLELTACLARWVNASSLLSTLDTHHSSVTSTLCRWAVSTSTKLNNSYARALLASVLLSGDKSFLSMLPGDLYNAWVVPLAASLESTPGTGDILHLAIWRNLENGREQKMLSNLLESDSQLLLNVQERPTAMLQIVYQVLCKGGDLTLMSSLLVRGDSLDPAKQAKSSTDVSESTELDDSDHDDYDDGEGTKDPIVSSSSQASKNLKPSYRLGRRDLLTLQKLDKLYQDRIQQQTRDCKTLNMVAAMKPSAIGKLSMAKTLVRAPWLNWGLHILNRTSPTRTTRRLFVESLGLLMQSMTGLRTSTKVGPLSGLAFNKLFMVHLWRYTMDCPKDDYDASKHRALAMCVFCDLFAHYLVALSDLDFLRYHTEEGTAGDQPGQGVVATDVIANLRDSLYDLYWANPVLVGEVESQSARGRLLLSATKVWNSLYERWNRFVRSTSFSEESTWWFPHLSSREGDHAVTPSRATRELHRDDDEMDLDDEENDSDVEDHPLSGIETETDALADAFSDPKMARVLTSIPQALPFGRRVKLFSSLLKADKQKTMHAASSRAAHMAMAGADVQELFFDGIARERVTIRRAKLYEDSKQQLSELGSKLKHKVQVSFVNQHGAEEAGIDGGGVFKEFLDDLIKDGFASSNGSDVAYPGAGAPPLFSVTPSQMLAVNFDVSEDETMLEHYKFLGRVLGKAVYESILVEPQFCLPFLNQLLGKTNSMEDLKNYDEEYYNNLNKLKLLNDAEVEALGITFEVTIGGSGHREGSSPKTVELMTGGGTIPVKTKAHVFQYIHCVANQILNVQGARQTKAFLRGFRDLIPASWVRLFSASELQNLISGDDSIRGIDVASLKLAINYLGGYHSSQPYIQDFWDIIENELTPEQQRKFLRFMTSCSRQPLLGFASLDPSPSIQQIRLTDDELSKNSKLPTSQTCFNLLKLPNYRDKALLKAKLLAAIESGAGFELT